MWPLIAQGVIRAVPWVAGYFIVDEVTNVFNGEKSNQGFTKQSSGKTDFEKIIDGDVIIPSLSGRTPVPSAPDNGFFEGVEFNINTAIKLAAFAGVAYVGFKALNEGKKLL